MPSSESLVLNRLLQIVAIFTCSVTLLAAPAQAAQRKKVEIQKTQSSGAAAKRSNAKTERVARASKTSKVVAVSKASRVSKVLAVSKTSKNSKVLAVSRASKVKMTANSRAAMRPVAVVIPALAVVW